MLVCSSVAHVRNIRTKDTSDYPHIGLNVPGLSAFGANETGFFHSEHFFLGILTRRTMDTFFMYIFRTIAQFSGQMTRLLQKFGTALIVRNVDTSDYRHVFH